LCRSAKKQVFSLFIPKFGKEDSHNSLVLESYRISLLSRYDCCGGNSLVPKELEQISMDTSSVVDEWHGNSASRSTFGGATELLVNIPFERYGGTSRVSLG